MDQVFKFAIKIFLILVGGVMLLGGGICVATNAVFMFNSTGQVLLLLVLMGISILIAWIGWKVIELSGLIKSSRSGKEINSEMGQKWN